MPLVKGRRGKAGVVKKCPVCEKEFYVPQYRISTAKYCSVYCMNHGQYKSISKICVGCGKTFTVSNSRSRRKYCDEKCKLLTSIGIVEERRRQKVSTANSRGYSSRYLRKKTLDLHNHKCDICGYGEYDCCLDIHHIDNDPTNDLDVNRAVLCSICHRLLHKGVIRLCPSKKEKVIKLFQAT
jgi:hypothetical protein